LISNSSPHDLDTLTLFSFGLDSRQDVFRSSFSSYSALAAERQDPGFLIGARNKKPSPPERLFFHRSELIKSSHF
jgi:hypothetical protein